MGKVLAKEITDLVPQTRLEEMAVAFKQHYREHNNKSPHLTKFFSHYGIDNQKRKLIVAAFGGNEAIKRYFLEDIDISSDAVDALYDKTIVELIKRIAELKNRELIEILKAVGKSASNNAPSVTNQIMFDINEHMNKRIIDE